MQKRFTPIIAIFISAIVAGSIALGVSELYEVRYASGAISATSVVGTASLVNGTASTPSLSFTNSSNTGFYLSASGVIGVTQGGVPSLLFGTGGNIGIGTGTPGTALSVTGRGIFTLDVFARNFIATSTSDINIFPVASSTSLSIANLFQVAGTGTSTFTGGSTFGGLSTSQGLVLTGGCITQGGNCLQLLSGSGTTTANAAFNSPGLQTTSGLVSTAGDFILTGGKIVQTGVSTSTFVGGISVAGLDASSGFRVSGGSTILTGGLNVTAAGTSTSLNGLTVSGITSSGGIAIISGCYLTPSGTCLSGGGGGANPGGSVNQFQYQVNGTTFGGAPNLLFNSSGNIGIGATSTPGKQLAVHGEEYVDATTTVSGIISTTTSFYVGGKEFRYPGTVVPGNQEYLDAGTNSNFQTASTTYLALNNDGITQSFRPVDWAEVASLVSTSSGASISINNLPSRSAYFFQLYCPGSGTANGSIGITFNGDSAADYVWTNLNGATFTSGVSQTKITNNSNIICGTGATYTGIVSGYIYVNTGGGTRKAIVDFSDAEGGADATVTGGMNHTTGAWFNTGNSITTITFSALTTATFNAGMTVRIFASKN